MAITIRREKYNAKDWNSEAIPLDANGRPIDREHGLTLDSIKELGHDRFKKPEQLNK